MFVAFRACLSEQKTQIQKQIKIIGYKNKNLHLDGLDLNPIFKGKTFENRSLFYHFPVYLEAYNVHLDNGTDPLFRTRPGSVIIKDNWKLHHYFEDGKIELYNIEEDISESTDLSKTNLEKTNPEKTVKLVVTKNVEA